MKQLAYRLKNIQAQHFVLKQWLQTLPPIANALDWSNAGLQSDLDQQIEQLVAWCRNNDAFNENDQHCVSDRNKILFLYQLLQQALERTRWEQTGINALLSLNNSTLPHLVSVRLKVKFCLAMEIILREIRDRYQGLVESNMSGGGRHFPNHITTELSRLFDCSPNPTWEQKKLVCETYNLTMEQVNNWFNLRRYRNRKSTDTCALPTTKHPSSQPSSCVLTKEGKKRKFCIVSSELPAIAKKSLYASSDSPSTATYPTSQLANNSGMESCVPDSLLGSYKPFVSEDLGQTWQLPALFDDSFLNDNSSLII